MGKYIGIRMCVGGGRVSYFPYDAEDEFGEEMNPNEAVSLILAGTPFHVAFSGDDVHETEEITLL